MLSELAEGIPGIGLSSQLKGPEDGKKGLFKDEDPFLVEKATLPTGVFAVHVFGCENIFMDRAFPSEHFGMYVRITAGSATKCTSLQSPLKKGRVVWNEVRNFPVTISSKVTNPVNKVIIAVLGVDKLQAILKPKLLGKTEFHLHKLAKKQWSMETFELQNRKKQYAGDIQLELAFAYGFCGYGLCDQIESHHPPRYYLQQSTFPHLELLTSLSGNSSGIVFAPKRVSHPSIIPFKHKVTNLEPEFSPYYSGTNFVRIDTKSRPHLREKMTRLNQLHSDYFQLTKRTKRINFLKRLLQEKDLQGSIPGDQNSDSDSSSPEDLGQVTQFGLTGVLAQMANLTFMAGAPELIEFAQKDGHSRSSAPGPNQLTEENRGMDKDGERRSFNDTLNVAGTSGLPLETRSGLDGSVSNAADSGGETRLRKVDVQGSDSDAIEETEQDEHDIMAAAASRGRRTAIVARRPGQKKPKQATGENVTNV